MIYVSFFIGLLLICKGGDWFVDAASNMAKALGIPKYIVGATVVSLATTMPEIIVSVSAAMRGSAVMAAGNAVGSVSANTGLILGLSLFCLPGVIPKKEYRPKNLMYIGCVLLLLMTFFDRVFDRTDSMFMLAAGMLFVFLNIKNARRSQRETEGGWNKREGVLWVFFFLFGAVCIVVGAELLIDASCALARQFHISEEIISVTIVAMGTSLPEFITTVTAILKRESSLSVGNIIGANVIDVAFILPICTLFTGRSLPVAEQMASADAPVCFLLALTALLPMTIRGKIKRMDGFFTMTVYACYLILIMKG